MYMKAMYTGFEILQIWCENQTVFSLPNADLADLLASTTFGSQVHGNNDVRQ
jgi:hypothetical protein